MRNRLHVAAFAFAALVLPTADIASAVQIHQLKGTRDQVRNACTGPDRELIELGNETFCADNKKGTSVVCGDDGKCVGSTPRMLLPPAIRRFQAPPASLSDGVGGNGEPGEMPSPPPVIL